MKQWTATLYDLLLEKNIKLSWYEAFYTDENPKMENKKTKNE